MKQNQTWLQKEINRDKTEVTHNKNKVIRDILKTPKKEITGGSVILKKDSIWKKVIDKLKGL